MKTLPLTAPKSLLAFALALPLTLAACAPSTTSGGTVYVYRASSAALLRTIAAACPGLQPSAFYNNYDAGVISGNTVTCDAQPTALVRNATNAGVQSNSGFVPTPARLMFTATPQGSSTALVGTLRVGSEAQSPESINRLISLLDQQYPRVR